MVRTYVWTVLLEHAGIINQVVDEIGLGSLKLANNTIRVFSQYASCAAPLGLIGK